MTRLLTLAALVVALGGSATVAQADDGKGQPSANASPMGIERATRNSAGGDREKGAFGEAQSAFVKEVQPYGQWLKENGWTGSDK